MLTGFGLKYTKNRKRLLAIPHDCTYFAGGSDVGLHKWKILVSCTSSACPSCLDICNVGTLETQLREGKTTQIVHVCCSESTFLSSAKKSVNNISVHGL